MADAATGAGAVSDAVGGSATGPVPVPYGGGGLSTPGTGGGGAPGGGAAHNGVPSGPYSGAPYGGAPG